MGFIPGLGRAPEGGHGNPLQYSCLENPHGQRCLAGYSPWGRKELDTTGRLSTISPSGGSDSEESACNEETQVHPCAGKIPWTWEWQPTPLFLPGESHRQRSLVAYSPWGCKRDGHNSATKQQQQMYPYCTWASLKKSFLLPDFIDNKYIYTISPSYCLFERHYCSFS